MRQPVERQPLALQDARRMGVRSLPWDGRSWDAPGPGGGRLRPLEDARPPARWALWPRSRALAEQEEQLRYSDLGAAAAQYDVELVVPAWPGSGRWMGVLQAVKEPTVLPRHWAAVELPWERPPAARRPALPLPALLG
jgi:hypothetical protein